jgi:hypothetical protein
MTVSWTAFHAADAAFADTVEARFSAHRHHVLATLRADGSPRLSGIEADFRRGELWLGMMPNSRKALDLLRDPRFSLFANPGPGTDLGGGDVRISGRAIPAGPETVTAYAKEAGQPEPFHLFRVEVGEVVRTSVEGEELVVLVWRPGRVLRTIRRGNDDSSPRENTHRTDRNSSAGPRISGD